MILKNKCLVLLCQPEQKPNKDPPMIVIPYAPIAQNAMLCVCANQNTSQTQVLFLQVFQFVVSLKTDCPNNDLSNHLFIKFGQSENKNVSRRNS